MKKSVAFIFVVLFLISFTSCHKKLEENDSLPPTAVKTAAFQAPEQTKIYNDFAGQLPAYVFKNPIVENYDESLFYEFTVKSNNAEFRTYVETLKANGFNSGTEGAPVSGEGYYKAINSDRYMVEAVLKNGSDLTVTVSRP